jgi:acetoin utilization protein AcuB
MRVFEVMTEEVRTVSPGSRAADAWQLMRTEGIHHLVVSDGRRILGVLSDRDAGGRAGGGVRAGKTVREMMSAPVLTVKSRETLRRAANLMRGHSIGCLPVVDAGKLVGIVTTANLLDAVGGGADRPASKTRRDLSHRVAHRRQHAATGVW